MNAKYWNTYTSINTKYTYQYTISLCRVRTLAPCSLLGVENIACLLSVSPPTDGALSVVGSFCATTDFDFAVLLDESGRDTAGQVQEYALYCCGVHDCVLVQKAESRKRLLVKDRCNRSSRSSSRKEDRQYVLLFCFKILLYLEKGYLSDLDFGRMPSSASEK